MHKNSRKKYDFNELKKEREYGFYWYSVIWRILRPVLILLISLIVAIGIVGVLYSKVYDEYIAPINLKDKAEILFTVENGTSLSKVSKNLEKQGLVRNSHVFKYFADFIGLGQKIQSGDYILNKSMTIDQIANTLTSGDGKPITFKLTIIPGQNIEDIATSLFEQSIIKSKEEFLELCKTGIEYQNYYFIDDLIKNSSAKRKYLLEGYLAANTYDFYTNTSEKNIISKLLTQTDKMFTSAYYDRAKEIGMSMDEVLTLASIIEKEAKTADFTKVSAIFHNRLKKGMKLQSDVTVHYVTNVRRMLLSKNDTNINSPYNTYLVKGLPPGPICAPSPNAVYAALFPDENFIKEEYLYFCSTNPDTGELYFSKTLKEHEKAVETYAPLWREFDKKRGLIDER